MRAWLPCSLCVVSEPRACVRSQPFCVPVSCHMCGSWLGLSSFDAQLASLASLEDGVTHGLHSLLESPSGLSRQSHLWSRTCLPRFCGLDPARVLPCLWSPSGPPFCSVNVGLLVCPSRCQAAPPDRSVSTHRRSGSPACRVELRSAACAANASVPSEPRAAAADPSASPARPASGRPASGAAQAKATQAGQAP